MGSVNLWKSHSQEVVETPSLESFSAKWKNCSIKEDYPTLEEEGLDEQYVFSIFNFYSFGKKKKRKGKLKKGATWWNILEEKKIKSRNHKRANMSKRTNGRENPLKHISFNKYVKI